MNKSPAKIVYSETRSDENNLSRHEIVNTVIYSYEIKESGVYIESEKKFFLSLVRVIEIREKLLPSERYGKFGQLKKPVIVYYRGVEYDKEWVTYICNVGDAPVKEEGEEAENTPFWYIFVNKKGEKIIIPQRRLIGVEYV